MVTGDHSRYEQDVGAYLLDALSDLERTAFERHLAGCSLCRDEIERLRPAADALPRSVTPVAPPASLKASVMEVVEREAGQAQRGRRASALRERLGRLLPRPGPVRLRPLLAWTSASFVLALAILAAGFGVSRVTSDGDDGRTLSASVDRARVPSGSASLVVPASGDDGAILRVRGLPALRSGRVYQVWLKRDGDVVSESIFSVGAGGAGAAAVPDDLKGAESVLVTRERAGGASAPTERPVMRIRL